MLQVDEIHCPGAAVASAAILRTILLLSVFLAIPLPAYSQDLQSVGQTRQATDGTSVTTSGIVIYGSPGYKNGFIIESTNRSAGILVTGNRMPLSGDIVTVSGTAASLRGERAIINATVTIDSSGNPLPKPFGTRLSGLTEPGAVPTQRNLLLRIYGQVRETGAGYLYIDDGSVSGRGMKVIGSATGADVGDFVIGTGLALIDMSATAENSGVIILGWSLKVTKVAYTGRSQDDIIERWNALKPSATGSPYFEMPSWVFPFAAGSLTTQFQQDAINMLNFMRYVARVPDDVVGEPAWYDEQQHGAVILKALGILSHTPPQPAGMTNEFYSLAYSSCNSSGSLATVFGMNAYSLVYNQMA